MIFGIKSTICGHQSSREMPGIDSSRFVSLTDFLAKHLKCCICLNVFDRAVTNDCGHTYCRDCIADWIASDRHDCPECRRPLATRKRSQEMATPSAAANDTQTLFIARGFVLEYNLKINSMIGEMHIKCRHESTGCLEELELALMAAHEAVCTYRLCPVCGLTPVGPVGEGHNCLRLVMADRDAFRERSITTDCEYVMFGTFRGKSRAVEMDPSGVTLRIVRMSCLSLASRAVITIKWPDIRQLLYCLDPILPIIFILPLFESSFEIKEWLDSAHEDNDGDVFDTISDDPKVRYIKIMLTSGVTTDMVNLLKRYNGSAECECRHISLDGAKRLLLRYQTRRR
ncbi:unnamed protein product [Medioppia subpectinata]|uniref:RING-type domain-containing protein n=1 Tax=Medioppia subpectinata TaxID=1979941 RepID=A0A7R9KP69_9ACAR|nr:unnamed protein product [Medioppia subpectinata]CAG2106927.1 unnamed protein product [Medioppia subpectinata]